MPHYRLRHECGTHAAQARFFLWGPKPRDRGDLLEHAVELTGHLSNPELFSDIKARGPANPDAVRRDRACGVPKGP
jgi:hypothetical protein